MSIDDFIHWISCTHATAKYFSPKNWARISLIYLPLLILHLCSTFRVCNLLCFSLLCFLALFSTHLQRCHSRFPFKIADEFQIRERGKVKYERHLNANMLCTCTLHRYISIVCVICWLCAKMEAFFGCVSFQFTSPLHPYISYIHAVELIDW